MEIDSQILKQLVNTVGSINASTAHEDLLVYSYDATKQRGVPDIVLTPHSAQEISAIMRVDG